MFFTPRVNDLVLAGFLDKGHVVARNEAPSLPTLTVREREITQLLAEGKEFQGSSHAAEFEHQDRGNSSQQHHAKTQSALDSRSGGLRHQEQHHPDPDAGADSQRARNHRRLDRLGSKAAAFRGCGKVRFAAL